MYEDQKQKFRKIIEQLGNKEMKLDMDDPDYDEKFNKLEENKMACQQLVEQMQAKRLALLC